MKNKMLVFYLLSWSIVANAKLGYHALAQDLHVSQELAKRLIKRVECIDRLNTSHASYYTILTDVFWKPRGYKIGCEIGVFTAGHAQAILANSNIEKLYCVDSYIAPMNIVTTITEGFQKNYWQACWDTIYYYAVDKLSAFGDRVQFFRLAADKAASRIADDSLDFVFIDGDHSYRGALEDCKNYYDKVRSGGIISGDDYDIDDVGRAVREFFGQKSLVVNIYPGQTRFWWVEKP